MNRLIKAIKDPAKVLSYVLKKNIIKFSDETYIKIQYRLTIKKKLDLDNPVTFNEKLQWLKLHDRNPEYTKMVDKYEVKKYVASIIGEEYIIPTLAVYDKFDEIEWEKLPNQFVIKCTHDSGGIVICKDKSKLNKKKARKKINKCLKRNYYYIGREWPYKNIKPRIIIEKYIQDDTSNVLKDYKFFCFNGMPKMLFVAIDRNIDTKFDFYDLDLKKINLKQHYENSTQVLNKPQNFEKMIELSKILAKNIPHIRVDFYNINGKIYFGELTLYHFNGFEKFEPQEYDYLLGSWLELPKNKKE